MIQHFLKNKSNLFKDDKANRTIVYNSVSYVDEIIRYPVRSDSFDWLANLIFIKNSEPYRFESEFRVLLTEDFLTNYNRNNKEDFFRKTVDKLSDLPIQDLTNRRFVIDRKFITKVYFTDSILDKSALTTLLKQLNISYEKL